MSFTIKSGAEIDAMRVACRLASEVLDYLEPLIQPGITTKEIDRLAHDYMVNVQGTVSATLNYQPPGHVPYPASLCTSVNEVVCHGVPNEVPLKSGDIVNIDVTVIKDGWYGDNSRMYLIGKPSIAAARLCQVTYESMWKGIVRSSRARAWATSAMPSRPSPKARASRWCASTAATASVRSSTKTRRSCTTAVLARAWSWCQA